MKKIIIYVSFIALITLFVSCGNNAKNTVNTYLEADKKSDYSTEYSLVSTSDRNAKSLEDFTEEKKRSLGFCSQIA